MERHNRFFVEDLADEAVSLSVGEAHHAMHVMRMGVGDAVELFDGRGGGAEGEIAEARRGKVVVRVARRRPASVRPGPAIHLAFAVPKGKRLDWLLEKATELAARSLTPVGFERSVVTGAALAGGKRDRWLGHCIAAAKQSGQDWLPELCEPIPLADFFARFARPGRVGIVGSVGIDAISVGRALASALTDPAAEIWLLVGPEGGLTAGEQTAATDVGLLPACLGNTTLRIETAAIALLAATRAILESR